MVNISSEVGVTNITAVLKLSGDAENNLVVGVPTRYGDRDGVVAALRSNAFMSIFAFGVIFFKYGGIEGFKAEQVGSDMAPQHDTVRCT